MNYIRLRHVKKFYGAFEALTDINIEINKGQTFGVVGANGSGKTTLFKLIAGRDDEYQGDLYIAKGIKVAYLEQIPQYDKGIKVRQVIRQVFEPLESLQEEMKRLEEIMADAPVDIETVLIEYGDIQQAYNAMGGYELEAEYQKIVQGLKLSEQFLDMPFYQLSGGQKTKTVLLSILMEKPDLLMLDEPTNHLDLKTIQWLEGYIKSIEGACIIISHDRYFLDAVATDIIEIERKISKVYKGNYSAFIDQKKADYENQLKMYENQQKKIAAMEKTIKDLKDWGQRADNEKFFRRAFSMEKRLEKMDKVDKPFEDNRKIKGRFDDMNRSGKLALIIDNLTFGYDQNLLEDAELEIYYGEKVCLIGDNGTGKTTLFKLVLDDLEPDMGSVKVGASVKLGYLPQEIVFQQPSQSMLDYVNEQMGMSTHDARNYLARFKFYGEDVFKNLGQLSGGEASRLYLAKLMHDKVNFLILDEPTNHLDIPSREDLESILSEFNGTILFISHDRYFINKICDYIVCLDHKILKGYMGNYEYYLEHLKKPEEKYEEVGKVTSSNLDYKQKKNEEAKRRKRESDLKKTEDEINSCEMDLVILEEEMGNTSDHELLNSLFQKKMDLENRLNTLYNTWEKLQES